MFESAVANVLNSVLGDYVANLESQQLNIGIWKGNVVLHNLRLRKEALDKFHLPVDVVEGFLGELTLKIPWQNLKGRPIQISVKDLYLIATPKSETEYDAKDEAERDYQAKVKDLKTAEMVSQQPHEMAKNADDKKEQTFVAQLITKITDNLQFSIKNIHIRYEDRASNPEHPFAVGITLGELSAVSTDENWLEAFVHDSKGTIHKLLTLSALAVYCDTNSDTLVGLTHEEVKTIFEERFAESSDETNKNYIMKPISGSGRVVVNKHFGGSTPKNDVRLLFEDLAFSLNEEQYKDALNAAGLFQLYARQAKYRKFRPPHGIKPKGNPGPWLHFATNAILHEVHEKHKQWSWSFFKERRDDRKAYIRLWSTTQVGRTLAASEAGELENLERKLSLDDLRLYRSIARVGIKKERAILAKQEPAHHKSVVGSAVGAVGWLGGWLTGSGHSDKSDADGSLAPAEMTEEQRQKLYDTIEYDDSTAEAAFDVPETTALHSIRAHLRSGSVSILRGAESGYAPLAEITFVDVTTAVLQRPTSLLASAELGGIAIRDGTTPGSLYPMLVRDKDSNDGKLVSSVPLDWAEADALVSEKALSSNSLFRLNFEHAPLDKKADDRVTIKAHPLVITFNPLIVEALSKFFQPPAGDLESVTALMEAAGSKFEGLKAQTKAGLEYALDKHRTLDLNLEIDAPIFVFPEDVTDKDANVLLIDSGHVAITSEFASSDLKANALELLGRLDGEKESSSTKMDPELEKLLYDAFNVDLTSVQVLVGNSFTKCLEALHAKKATDLHIIEQSGINAAVQMAVIPDAPNLTKMKVSGHLPSLNLNLSDRNYKAIMRIVDIVLAATSADESPQDSKPDLEGGFTSNIGWFSDASPGEAPSNYFDGDTTEDEGDEFFDAPDGSEVIPAKKKAVVVENPERSLFEFKFSVESLTTSLKKSTPDGLSDRVLAEMNLSGFMMSMVKRPFDMAVDVVLNSLYVTDMAEPEHSSFRMLATSHPTLEELEGRSRIKEVASPEPDLPDSDLVKIVYQKVERTHPQYVSRYASVDQSVDAEFDSLHINVTSRSILSLYDFMLATFVNAAPANATGSVPNSPLITRNQTLQPDNNLSTSRSSIHRAIEEPQPPPEPEVVEKSKAADTTVVKARMRRVSLVLNNDGTRVGTLIVKELDASVHLKDDTLRVNARLGGLALRDDTQNDREVAFHHILDMQSKEAAYFRYETFNVASDDYPGYDASIYLRAGSARITFIEIAIKELLDFASRFAAMHMLFEKARSAAAESAAQLQDRANRLHFDIAVESPVVVFPRNATAKDFIKANLGELKISNVFELPPDSTAAAAGTRFIDKITIDLNEISLASTFYTPDKRQLDIIQKVDISVNIAYTEHMDGDNTPVMAVNGSFKNIKIQLTEKQYETLLEISKAAGRVFGGEEISNESDAQGKVENKSHDSQYIQLSAAPEKPRRAANTPSNVAVWTKLDVSFALPSLQLEVFRDSPKGNDGEATSLALFSLNSTNLKCNIQSTDALELELQIRSFTVSDTRPDLENKFREIIPASAYSEEQFMVRYSSTPKQGATANVTVDSPKVILVLDHVFALQQFFMNPLTAVSEEAVAVDTKSDTEPNATSRQNAIAAQKDSSTDESPISFRVNIVDAEIIVLDDPHSDASEAIFLSAKRVVFSQQGILALTVDQIGLFLCRMDKREDTTLRLIENFDIVLSMDNRDQAEKSVTTIAIDMKPVIARVSFRDAFLVMGILTKANELRSNAIGAAPGDENPKEETETSIGDIIASHEKDADDNDHDGDRSINITSKESLKLTIQGLQMIMIDDLNDLNVPVIDVNIKPFEVDLNDWSTQMKAATTLKLSTNYFNIKNSSWEPLIEPWEFKMNVSQKQATSSMLLDFYSNKQLDLNVSHSFIEMGLTTLHLWGKQAQRALPKARGQLAPYVFQNRTGYPVHVWPEMTNKKKDVAIQTIPSGGDLKFRFEDWRTMRESTSGVRNRVGLQFEDVLWESLKDVPVDREGVSHYCLRPKINQVSHRLVVDVKMKENVKYVIFRSALLVQNRTTVALETTVIDSRGNMAPMPSRIAPGEECAIPIEAAYHNRLKVRPAGFGYAWSKEHIFWRHLLSDDASTSVHCDPFDQNNVQFRFQIRGVVDEKEEHSDVYPAMVIRLSPPIELENLLPHDIKFHIYDKNRGGSPFSTELAKGGISPVYFAEMQHLLLIGIEIPATDYRPSELAILSSPTDEFDIDRTITLTDPMGLKLMLGIQSYEVPDSGGAMKYSIYAPYVMLNKTGLDIYFREKALLHSTKIAAGQSSHRRDQPATPFMFSFTEGFTIKNRVMVKVGDSEWGKPMSFDAVGSVTELKIPSATKSEEIHLGISIATGEGRYAMTKLVTFTPRFILKNNLSEGIQFREPGEVPGSTLKAGEKAPLHFLKQEQLRQLTLCYPGLNNSWSAPFNIADVGKVHIKLSRNGGNETRLLRADILLEGATIFIVFNEEKGEWPFKIVNETDVNIIFYQHNPHNRDRDTNTSGSAEKQYRLSGDDKTRYSWDFPSFKQKLLVLRVNGREREINIAEIGQLEPLKYPNQNGYSVMAVDVYAEGTTQVLRLSRYNESRSVYRPKRSNSTSSIASKESSKEGFEVIDVDAKTSMVFQIRLEGIGISVINKRTQELIYASLRGLEFTYRDTTIHSSLGLKIKWLQVDNQLYGGLDPIIIYPTVIPRVGRETEIHPTIQAAIVRSKDTSHGVDYFKYFSALLQEMSIDVDEDFLFALIDFLRFDVHGWDDNNDGDLCDEVLQIPEPVKSEVEDKQSYFEGFEIHPLKLNLSFVRTERVNQEGGRTRHANIVGFLVNILTMAIGNINDAPIKLNSLKLENLRVSFPDLASRIASHYGQEFFYQVHKLLGSADVLGNPVGLFNTVSSGISDIFYEPYQGFVSDRPQDFGIGLARGTTSFFKKTVYGVSDSFAKFTGSVGKGLSAATLDKAYQDRRRISRARNKPKHVLGGVSVGAGTFVKSVSSGVTGIVRQPFEGAEQSGVGGFFKGIGKGLVGAVVKPAVGVFDLASTVTEGIKNTTTVFDENEIDRMRLPRYIGRDRILKAYSSHDALGLMWLKELENGRYFYEDYVAHVELAEDDRIVMLTYRRIIQFRSSRLKTDWDLRFSELRSVRCAGENVTVNGRNGNEAHEVPIKDSGTRSWFYRKIEGTIQEYNAAHRSAE